MNLISKIDVKMNLRIITKNLAVDSKIVSALKIDFTADWAHESNPTAWELIRKKNLMLNLKNLYRLEDVQFAENLLSASFSRFIVRRKVRFLENKVLIRPEVFLISLIKELL